MEDTLAQILFKIDSNLPSEVIEDRKFFYQKEKTKNFSIIDANGKTIGKLHSLLLEEYENTLNLFESNALNLEKGLNENYVEIIIKYLYLKEISPISIIDVFHLFKIAVFMKIDEVYTKIIEFLNNNINDAKKAAFIAKNSHELIYSFKDEAQRILGELIEKCLIFLLENKCFNELFSIFDSHYFNYYKDCIEGNLKNLLFLMKKIKTPNQEKMRMVHIFKDDMLKYLQKDKNFSKDQYFRELIEDNFELSTCEMNELDGFLKKLEVQNVEIKDFSIKILSEKVTALEKENYNLKNLQIETEKKQNLEIEKQKSMILDQNAQIDSLKNEINAYKEISEKRNLDLEKIYDNKLMVVTSMIKRMILNEDEVLLFLMKQFPQFNGFDILYDSTKEDKNVFINRVKGKKNVVFIMEPTNHNLIFGAFYSIELPPIGEDKSFKDDNSCIFEIKKNQVFKADKNKDKQLRALTGYNYLFGNTGNLNGFYIDSNWLFYFGKKTDEFEGENSFGFSSQQKDPLKRMLVYHMKE